MSVGGTFSGVSAQYRAELTPPFFLKPRRTAPQISGVSAPFLLLPSSAPRSDTKGEGTLCLRKQALLFIASRSSNPHFPAN